MHLPPPVRQLCRTDGFQHPSVHPRIRLFLLGEHSLGNELTNSTKDNIRETLGALARRIGVNE
eukprot:7227341-Heterocapsa_arctica.AAC.1